MDYIWSQAVQDESRPSPASFWQHSVRGSFYRVFGVTKHQASDDTDQIVMVIYWPCTANGRRSYPMWLHPLDMCSRPLSEWQELVELDGEKAPRFVPAVPKMGG